MTFFKLWFILCTIALFLGTYFSSKKYKLKNWIIFLLITIELIGAILFYIEKF